MQTGRFAGNNLKPFPEIRLVPCHSPRKRRPCIIRIPIPVLLRGLVVKILPLVVLAAGVLFSALVQAGESSDQEAEEKTTVYIGAGPYIQSQPYEGADPLVLASPVGIFDNRLFYVRWARLGMYFYGGDNWGMSITAQPRPFGYRTADSPALAGMADRNTSWEAGLAISGKNKAGFAELVGFQDILGNSNGYMTRLELGKLIPAGRWFFQPSLYLLYYSDRFNNYYYGVRDNEATASRPAYRAGGGLNLAAQTYIMYDFSKHWHFLGNVRIDYLSSQIRNSPIVGDDFMISGLLSVLYSFDY